MSGCVFDDNKCCYCAPHVPATAPVKKRTASAPSAPPAARPLGHPLPFSPASAAAAAAAAANRTLAGAVGSASGSSAGASSTSLPLSTSLALAAAAASGSSTAAASPAGDSGSNGSAQRSLLSMLEADSPILSTYCVDRRIVIAESVDATNVPVPAVTLAGFLPQRSKGPYTLAAGDFSSDDDNSDDDSDDDATALVPFAATPSTAGPADDDDMDGSGAPASSDGGGGGSSAGSVALTPVGLSLEGKVLTEQEATSVRSGALTVLRWGRIVRCRPGYHTARLLFPVGYRAVRIFWGPHARAQRSGYVCDIQPMKDVSRSSDDAAPKGRLAVINASMPPQFVITSVLDPSLRVTGGDPDGAWGGWQ